MKAVHKGMLLGAVQLALVVSLSAKLLYDRKTRPRVWVECRVWDPELPIRGRYLAEQLVMPAEGFTYAEPKQPNISPWYLNQSWGYLSLRNGQLIAEQQGTGDAVSIYLQKEKDGTVVALTQEPVLIFIADTANIGIAKPGQQMWVEVTIPRKGPPRPIRVGLKTNGVLTPLDFH